MHLPYPWIIEYGGEVIGWGHNWAIAKYVAMEMIGGVLGKPLVFYQRERISNQPMIIGGWDTTPHNYIVIEGGNP